MNGKYSSFLSNITSFLISKNNDGVKIDKAKKWNINVVNGIWLMELYLGNTYALTQPLDERYTNLSANHFGYDPACVHEFMEQWKSLIKLPLEKIKASFDTIDFYWKMFFTKINRKMRFSPM